MTNELIVNNQSALDNTDTIEVERFEYSDTSVVPDDIADEETDLCVVVLDPDGNIRASTGTFQVGSVVENFSIVVDEGQPTFFESKTLSATAAVAFGEGTQPFENPDGDPVFIDEPFEQVFSLTVTPTDEEEPELAPGEGDEVLDPASNFAEAELASSLSPGASFIEVDDPSAFPDPTGPDTRGDGFDIVVFDGDAPSAADDAGREIIRINGVDEEQGILSVAQDGRGQQDTDPESHSVGDAVIHAMTARHIDEINFGLERALNARDVTAVDPLEGGSSADAGEDSFAAGQGATAERSSLAAGQSATSEGPNSSAIGQGARAQNDDVTAVGTGIRVAGFNATGVGAFTNVRSPYVTALGRNIEVDNASFATQVLGRNSRIIQSSSANAIGEESLLIDSVAATIIGRRSFAQNSPGTQLIGRDAIAEDSQVSVGIGDGSIITDSVRSTAIGGDVEIDGATEGLAIGFGTGVSAPRAVALGSEIEADEADTLVFGTDGEIRFKIESDGTVKAGPGAGALTELLPEEQTVGLVEDHRATEVHDEPQPPEEHGNDAHDDTVASQSDVDAKADDPHDNSAHSETFTTADDNVEGFATEGEEGTVPTSQGDGTLAMEEAGGERTTVDPNEAVADEEPTADDSDAENPLAIGVAGNALANGDNSVAIGNGTEASAGRATALGVDATASASSATALGRSATASGSSAVALGNNVEASAFFATALGFGSDASGPSATALGRSATASGVSSMALGRDAEALTDDSGTLAVDTDTSGPSDWTVPGDFTVQGSKDFEIDHPSKPDTHDLRHGAYEGPVPGGLVYNATVTADDEVVSLEGHLPEYVTNEDFGTGWTCHVTASDHFGRGYVDSDEWMLVVEKPGDYEVTIFGERDDGRALDNGKHHTEKPKGECWNGEPRAYWRDHPHADLNDYDDVERIEEKFDHTPECDPEPCAEAHVMSRVRFDDGGRVEVGDAEFEQDADELVEAARTQREETETVGGGGGGD